MTKRALISVSDKAGIVEFAQELKNWLGYHLNRWYQSPPGSPYGQSPVHICLRFLTAGWKASFCHFLIMALWSGP